MLHNILLILIISFSQIGCNKNEITYRGSRQGESSGNETIQTELIKSKHPIVTPSPENAYSHKIFDLELPHNQLNLLIKFTSEWHLIDNCADGIDKIKNRRETALAQGADFTAFQTLMFHHQRKGESRLVRESGLYGNTICLSRRAVKHLLTRPDWGGPVFEDAWMDRCLQRAGFRRHVTPTEEPMVVYVQHATNISCADPEESVPPAVVAPARPVPEAFVNLQDEDWSGRVRLHEAGRFVTDPGGLTGTWEVEEAGALILEFDDTGRKARYVEPPILANAPIRATHHEESAAGGPAVMKSPPRADLLPTNHERHRHHPVAGGCGTQKGGSPNESGDDTRHDDLRIGVPREGDEGRFPRTIGSSWAWRIGVRHSLGIARVPGKTGLP